MTQEGRHYAYRERAHTRGPRATRRTGEGPPTPLTEGHGALARRKVRGPGAVGTEGSACRPLGGVGGATGERPQDVRRAGGFGRRYGTTTYRGVETVFFAVQQEAGAEVLPGLKAVEQELLSIDNLEAAATRLGRAAEVLLSEPHSYVDRFSERIPR
jgi:hypothetical protein